MLPVTFLCSFSGDMHHLTRFFLLLFFVRFRIFDRVRGWVELSGLCLFNEAAAEYLILVGEIFTSERHRGVF